MHHELIVTTSCKTKQELFKTHSGVQGHTHYCWQTATGFTRKMEDVWSHPWQRRNKLPVRQAPSSISAAAADCGLLQNHAPYHRTDKHPPLVPAQGLKAGHLITGLSLNWRAQRKLCFLASGGSGLNRKHLCSLQSSPSAAALCSSGDPWRPPRSPCPASAPAPWPAPPQRTAAAHRPHLCTPSTNLPLPRESWTHLHAHESAALAKVSLGPVRGQLDGPLGVCQGLGVLLQAAVAVRPIPKEPTATQTRGRSFETGPHLTCS